MSETTIRVEGLRAYPQGELFFLTKAGEGFDALVYNTTGRGPSPDEEFAAIGAVEDLRLRLVEPDRVVSAVHQG